MRSIRTSSYGRKPEVLWLYREHTRLKPRVIQWRLYRECRVLLMPAVLTTQPCFPIMNEHSNYLPVTASSLQCPILEIQLDTPTNHRWRTALVTLRSATSRKACSLEIWHQFPDWMPGMNRRGLYWTGNNVTLYVVDSFLCFPQTWRILQFCSKNDWNPPKYYIF